jgi:hypothetical protein
MRQKELQIREMETMANIEDKKERLKLDYAKMQERNAVERERITTNERVADDRIEAEIVKEVMSGDQKLSEEESRERIEKAKIGVEIAEIVTRDNSGDR